MTDSDLTEKVIGFSIDVHKQLGPGLLESVYKECLFYKLNKSGIFVEKEKSLPVVFEDVKIDCGFRLDLLIENRLVVECKSVSRLDDVHLAQLLTYLRLGKYEVGLLIKRYYTAGQSPAPAAYGGFPQQSCEVLNLFDNRRRLGHVQTSFARDSRFLGQ